VLQAFAADNFEGVMIGWHVHLFAASKANTSD
jgi:hypothetical protein